MSVPAKRFLASAALVALLGAVPARASAPAGRFTVSAGVAATRVVHDDKTGLNWQQAVSTTTYTYADAVTYCSGNAAGLAGSGWRLPAIKELQTLIDDSVALPGPTIDATAFPSTPGDAFWSSTPIVPNKTDVWAGMFYHAATGPRNMSLTAYVRCVR